MARRALVLVVAVVSFSLVACGGGSTPNTTNLPSVNDPGSGTGNGGPTAPPGATPTPAASAKPCGCTTIKEKHTKDKLLGGIALGQDNLIYATTAVGIDVFDQQLNLMPSPSPAQARIRDTWPTVPKNGAPSGLLASAGSTINALGTTPGTPGSTTTSFSLTSAPVPTPSSQPMLAQYNVVTKTWFNVSLGNFGDKWVSLASPGGTSVFVVGDRFAPATQWTGYLQGVGIGCISPLFAHPLGPSAIGPDGNLWLATDPSLNSNAPSNGKNPSMIFAVDPSTGTIKLSFTLPNHSHVSAIAAGDHAVWFTDDGLNEVGFIPIGGSGFTLLPLPNAGTAQAPVSITRDSMGRMWFTEFDGKRVGYVTPATQQITIFKVTGTPVGIVGCVPGQTCPQQNVFFAEITALGAASF